MRKAAPLRVWLLTGSAAIAAVMAVLVGQELATRRAVDFETNRVRATAVLLASSFRREIEKFRLMAVVLAEDREARLVLTTRQPADVQNLDEKLADLSTLTHAAAVYLLDEQGRTIAASNSSRPDSFVGQDYSFRSYFTDAMRIGQSQQFALGTRSRRPGLYLANRLGPAGRPLGVVVVKIEFDALEAEWRNSGSPAFATNQRGVILVTSEPTWRFETTSALSPALRDRIRKNLEFGSAPLVANTLYATSKVAKSGSNDAYARPYVEAIEVTPDGWMIHVLGLTVAPVAAAVTTARLILAIIGFTLVGTFLFWRHRRRSAAAKAEATVNAKVDVLNRRLVQANKLATLGQVAAGVGHEINQPLTAIGTYAHNARTLIKNDRQGEAMETIDRISALTDRIGVITRELRGFARRASEECGPLPIDEAMSGALLLLRDRIRTSGAIVMQPHRDRSLQVMAEHVRVEQVLVNLIQNALDAGAQTLTISTIVRDDWVEILIRDDGPGLSPSTRAGLFQPFTSSKLDGLGLGLVISRDIVVDFGGELFAGNPKSGAEFIVRLRRVP